MSHVITREMISPRVDAALRHVVAASAPLPKELDLENTLWGGSPASDLKRMAIQDDGELYLEARPPGWKAITPRPADWKPDIFSADVVGHGPLVIESGYSSAELVSDGSLERARVRGFAWHVVVSGAEPKLWVANVEFSGKRVRRAFEFPRGNLFVRTDAASSLGWRFTTPNGQIFLLPDEERTRWRIAFETVSGNAPPSDEHVARALALLGFTFGAPMRIGLLQAFSDAGPQGGLAYLGLADHRLRDATSNSEAISWKEVAWVVDFVDLAFAYMARFPDAPFLVAMHVFNAAQEGFVDTQFLLTFIAAETLSSWALSKGQLTRGGELRIADQTRWKAWVNTNKPAIQAMATAGNADSLVSRVLGSEFNTGTPVQKVFRGERIAWTEDMVDAEKARNSVAHEGLLDRYVWGSRKWTRDLERVEFVRFLFTATFSMLVRYHGPLASRGLPAAKLSWWWVADPAPINVQHVSLDP